MTTYSVIQGAPGYGWFVVERRPSVLSGTGFEQIVVSGPFTSKDDARADCECFERRTREAKS